MNTVIPYNYDYIIIMITICFVSLLLGVALGLL